MISHLQASAVELLQALQERSAVDIDGRWQLVDEEFMGTLLEIIVLTAQQNGWSLDRFPEDEAMEALVDDSHDARFETAILSILPFAWWRLQLLPILERMPGSNFAGKLSHAFDLSQICDG